MRKVRHVWPAWVQGMIYGACFVLYVLFIAPDRRREAHDHPVVELITGALIGCVFTVVVRHSLRDTFRVGRTVLTGAERVTALNLVRGFGHSDDWRLHQVATSIARRFVARSRGPLVLALGLTAAALMLVALAVSSSPRYWYIGAVLVVTAPFIFRWNHRQRAAARAYLAGVDYRIMPPPTGTHTP